jgi:hypothetical protein
MQISLTLGYVGFLETGMWGPAASNGLLAKIASSNNIFIYLFVFSIIIPWMQPKKIPSQ